MAWEELRISTKRHERVRLKKRNKRKNCRSKEEAQIERTAKTPMARSEKERKIRVSWGED